MSFRDQYHRAVLDVTLDDAAEGLASRLSALLTAGFRTVDPEASAWLVRDADGIEVLVCYDAEDLCLTIDEADRARDLGLSALEYCHGRGVVLQ